MAPVRLEGDVITLRVSDFCCYVSVRLCVQPQDMWSYLNKFICPAGYSPFNVIIFCF